MNRKDVPALVADGATLPLYASAGATGADIRAYIRGDIVIDTGEVKLIPTGLRFEIPEGYEIQVRPRSGLALRAGVTVLNTPGTIDSDYRGEIGIVLINHGKSPFIVTHNMRIAQLVLSPIYHAHFFEKKSLQATAREEGGFGHTGMH